MTKKRTRRRTQQQNYSTKRPSGQMNYFFRVLTGGVTYVLIRNCSRGLVRGDGAARFCCDGVVRLLLWRNWNGEEHFPADG